jgi:hypothetical protein
MGLRPAEGDEKRLLSKRCMVNDTRIYYWVLRGGWQMSNAAQKRAIKNYRNRLQKRGVARFEVLGLEADRVLIRSLAKRLAQDDPEANRIRSELVRSVSDMPKRGGILAALRRSPLAGAGLKMERSVEVGRKVNL